MTTEAAMDQPRTLPKERRGRVGYRGAGGGLESGGGTLGRAALGGVARPEVVILWWYSPLLRVFLG